MIPHLALLNVILKIRKERGFLDDLPGYKALASPHPESSFSSLIPLSLLALCTIDFGQSRKLFSREREKTGWWWGMRWTRKQS